NNFRVDVSRAGIATVVALADIAAPVRGAVNFMTLVLPFAARPGDCRRSGGLRVVDGIGAGETVASTERGDASVRRNPGAGDRRPNIEQALGHGRNRQGRAADRACALNGRCAFYAG